jgi:hypothetical protein
MNTIKAFDNLGHTLIVNIDAIIYTIARKEQVTVTLAQSTL